MQVIQGLGIEWLLNATTLTNITVLMLTFSAGALVTYWRFSRRIEAKVVAIRACDQQRNENSLLVLSKQLDSLTKCNAHAAQKVRSIIKTVINSQYVLTDKSSYGSLFQTPIRQSVQELRIVADTLLKNSSCSDDPVTTKLNESFESNKKDRINALHAFKAQISNFKILCAKRKVKFDVTCEISSDIYLNNNWIILSTQELLLNALKNNQASLALALNIHIDNKVLRVSVTDNGRGIDSCVTNLLASPNFLSMYQHRRKSDITDRYNLVTIKQFLSSVGGDLYIRTAKYFSTKVSLSVPLSALLSDSIETSDSPSLLEELNETELPTNKQAFRRSNTHRILIIGRAQDYITNLHNALAKEAIILRSSDIETALIVLSKDHVDCILIDAESDFANGLSLQSYVSQSGEHRDIPIIFLGQNDPNVTQLSVMQSGICGLIEKPIMPEAVKVLVDKVLKERQKMQYHVEAVLAEYHQHMSDFDESVDRVQDEFVTKFMHLLENHHQNEELSRPKAAEILCITDKTMARRLTKYYQVGFSELLKRYRLSKAKDMIIEGERITTAAYTAGFNSPSYFTQCFRAEYGFAPSMLTKQHKSA